MELDLSAFRPSRIWKRMTAERRQQAAENFWTDEQSADQQIEAITTIASHMKFRTKSVIALPLERKVKYLLGAAGHDRFDRGTIARGAITSSISGR